MKTFREILSLVENASVGSVSAGSIPAGSPSNPPHGERPSRKKKRLKGKKDNTESIFV